MRSISIFLFFIGGCIWAQAQSSTDLPLLTLDEAIQIAFKNNYSLKIQQQSQLVAQNNFSKANTGQLPLIDAVGSASYSNNFTDITLRTFQPEPPKINIQESGVESTTLSAGLEASYLLWDGGGRKYRYRLLEGLSDIEKYKQEALINGILAGISELYFEIVKIQNQEAFLLESITLNEERIKKIQDRAEFGKANKLAIVQAQTSLRQDESLLGNLSIVRTNLLLELKNLIHDNSETDYTLVASLEDPILPAMDNWQERMRNNNPQLILSQKGVSLAEIEIELSKAANRPSLVSFANAGYFYQQNDVQQLQQIQTLGGTIGISARFNIYDGGIKSIKTQNARIARDMGSIGQEQLYSQLLSSAKKEIATMRMLQTQIGRESSNQQTYQENYNKVSERFKLGKLPEITLREAQLILTNSRILISNLTLDFQKSSIRYQLLMGNKIE